MPTREDFIMSLLARIEQDYITAYKAKDALRLSVLRLVKAAFKNLAVDKRREITEEEAVDILLKQAKQRQDSITQFEAGGRQDLADKEKAELALIREYMPVFLEGDALAEMVEAAMAKVNAASPADMGKVIGAIMAEHKGKVDGKAVSDMVRAKLNG